MMPEFVTIGVYGFDEAGYAFGCADIGGGGLEAGGGEIGLDAGDGGVDGVLLAAVDEDRRAGGGEAPGDAETDANG